MGFEQRGRVLKPADRPNVQQPREGRSGEVRFVLDLVRQAEKVESGYSAAVQRHSGQIEVDLTAHVAHALLLPIGTCGSCVKNGNRILGDRRGGELRLCLDRS